MITGGSLSPYRNETSNLLDTARTVGMVVFAVFGGWILFEAFLLLEMYPMRPDNRLTWWAMALLPIPVTIIGSLLYMVKAMLSPLKPLFAWTGKIPWLLRMLFLVITGTLLVMVLAIHHRELDALWPFDLISALAFAKW
jgi:hypothetical protein